MGKRSDRQVSLVTVTTAVSALREADDDVGAADRGLISTHMPDPGGCGVKSPADAL